jgi:hypothetical protein
MHNRRSARSSFNYLIVRSSSYGVSCYNNSCFIAYGRYEARSRLSIRRIEAPLHTLHTANKPSIRRVIVYSYYVKACVNCPSVLPNKASAPFLARLLFPIPSVQTLPESEELKATASRPLLARPGFLTCTVRPTHGATMLSLTLRSLCTLAQPRTKQASRPAGKQAKPTSAKRNGRGRAERGERARLPWTDCPVGRLTANGSAQAATPALHSPNPAHAD